MWDGQTFRILLSKSVGTCVAYWPQLSCQKKKFTCVNNRCIRSKISGGVRIVTLAGSKWSSNYNITPATGSSDQSEKRCWNEDHVPAEAGPPGPRLSSPGERERNAVMAKRVGVNDVAVLFSLQLISHTTIPFITLSNPFK